MRKLMAIMVLAVAAAFITPNSASAQATVIKDFDCAIIPADWGGPIPLFSNESQTVGTPSGNVVLKCFFDIPAGLEPAKAVRNSGFPCGTQFGGTTNTKSVATPGGQVMLDCKINPSG